MKPMRQAPAASVVIPTKNEAKLLPACLTSLKNQQTTFPYEVIIVDTNSTDRTRQIAKQFHARIIDQPRPGKVLAFRTGATAAHAPIICFTEADCIVPPHWIETIVTYFQKHPRVVAISGIYTFHHSTVFYQLLARIVHPITVWLYVLTFGYHSLRASNFAIQKAVYKKTGGFSEKFHELYDVELGQRAAKFGDIHTLKELRIQTSDRRFRERILQFLKEFFPSFISAIIIKKPIPQPTYKTIR